jgi:TonB family protein
MRMRRACLLAILSIVLLGCAVACRALAQSVASTDTTQAEVVLVKLAPPVYPPLARQARIMGDVKVLLTIRLDGTVESAELFSGHPMLKQAALDSAKKSQFECRGCTDGGTSYSLTYTFGFQNDGGCKNVIEQRRMRSLKCLYLWQCGVRSVSTWHRPEDRGPEVTQSEGHVTVLVSSACVETTASH